jgi:hypothetical protein
MLSVVNKPFMLSVIMLNGVMLTVIMLNVVAPTLIPLLTFPTPTVVALTLAKRPFSETSRISSCLGKVVLQRMF